MPRRSCNLGVMYDIWSLDVLAGLMPKPCGGTAWPPSRTTPTLGRWFNLANKYANGEGVPARTMPKRSAGTAWLPTRGTLEAQYNVGVPCMQNGRLGRPPGRPPKRSAGTALAADAGERQCTVSASGSVYAVGTCRQGVPPGLR